MVGERQSTQAYHITRRCEHCHGRGYVLAAFCAVCGKEARTGPAVDEPADGGLPCGHSPERLVDREMICGVCEGRGTVTLSATRDEYDAARRSRRRRGVALFLLALIPLAAVSLAVWRAEPGTVCGSWWYGILLMITVLIAT